jgi:hypothetical protein
MKPLFANHAVSHEFSSKRLLADAEISMIESLLVWQSVGEQSVLKLTA